MKEILNSDKCEEDTIKINNKCILKNVTEDKCNTYYKKWDNQIKNCISLNDNTYYGINFGKCTECKSNDFYRDIDYFKYKKVGLGQPRLLCLKRPCKNKFEYYHQDSHTCKTCKESENVLEYDRDSKYKDEYLLSYNSNKCKIKKCKPGYYPSGNQSECLKCENDQDVIEWKNPGINCKIKKCNYTKEKMRTENDKCPPNFRYFKPDKTCFLRCLTNCNKEKSI